MRFLLLAFLSVLVSCGQQGGSSSKSGDGGHEGPNNEEYVTEVREVDLLDVAMDVPVEVSGNRIVFKQSVTNSASGVRSTCELGVTSGDGYNFQLRGSNLTLVTSTGQKMSFKRVSGSSGLVGSWSSKSYQGQQLVMRRLTFLTENRMIMRSYCEG